MHYVLKKHAPIGGYWVTDLSHAYDDLSKAKRGAEDYHERTGRHVVVVACEDVWTTQTLDEAMA